MVTWVPGHSVLHRFGQHVGGVVADQLERARVVARDEFDLRVVLDGIGEIDEHVPSSAMATVRLASEGEMPLATSRPVVPAG